MMVPVELKAVIAELQKIARDFAKEGTEYYNGAGVAENLRKRVKLYQKQLQARVAGNGECKVCARVYQINAKGHIPSHFRMGRGSSRCEGSGWAPRGVF